MRGGHGQEHWTYYTKIVAAPADATVVDGNWVDANGLIIGPVLWGEFATIMEVESGVGSNLRQPSRAGIRALRAVTHAATSQRGKPEGAVGGDRALSRLMGLRGCEEAQRDGLIAAGFERQHFDLVERARFPEFG